MTQSPEEFFRERYEPFVPGVDPEGIDSFEVVDPATNQPLTTVVEGGQPWIDAAVSKATEAQLAWLDYGMDERRSVMLAIANQLREEQERLASIETFECGRPISQSRGLLAGTAGYFEYYAGLIDKIEGESIPVAGPRLDYTQREPMGTVGVISPWNAPVLLTARSVAPALACGNAVVVKPASPAPVSTLEFASLATEAGLPPGTLTVVPGDGSRTGSALTSHRDIDGLVFTGSRRTGRTVMKDAAENIVPVGLELGGKSPGIVFPDANIDHVVEDMTKVFCDNAGQNCFALTRLFVHEAVYDDVVDKLVDRIESLTLGPGITDPDLGPLISPAARNTVSDYVETAVAGEGHLLTGGGHPDGDSGKDGNFFEPTLIEGVSDDAPISCEEVFGPVVTVYEFSSTDEVIERANDTDYGLYAAAWTDSVTLAHTVTNGIKAGTVSINEYPIAIPQAPSGGYKESGIGREKGQQAIHEYTELKNVAVNFDRGDESA